MGREPFLWLEEPLLPSISLRQLPELEFASLLLLHRSDLLVRRLFVRVVVSASSTAQLLTLVMRLRIPESVRMSGYPGKRVEPLEPTRNLSGLSDSVD